MLVPERKEQSPQLSPHPPYRLFYSRHSKGGQLFRAITLAGVAAVMPFTAACAGDGPASEACPEGVAEESITLESSEEPTQFIEIIATDNAFKLEDPADAEPRPGQLAIFGVENCGNNRHQAQYMPHAHAHGMEMEGEVLDLDPQEKDALEPVMLPRGKFSLHCPLHKEMYLELTTGE